MAATSSVYLLHFDPPYEAPIGETGRVKRAGHYLGSTALEPLERLAEHLAGRGSPLVRAAVSAGCRVQLVADGPGNRNLERYLKRRHRHAAYCPVCSRSPRPLTRPASGRLLVRVEP